MIIGIPKEIMTNENRVAAIPETVKKYRKLGFNVIVETNAGSGIYVGDADYEQAGAQIAPDAKMVYDQADIIRNPLVGGVMVLTVGSPRPLRLWLGDRLLLDEDLWWRRYERL